MEITGDRGEEGCQGPGCSYQINKHIINSQFKQGFSFELRFSPQREDAERIFDIKISNH